jgi:hypothetical protein
MDMSRQYPAECLEVSILLRSIAMQRQFYVDVPKESVDYHNGKEAVDSLSFFCTTEIKNEVLFRIKVQ